MKLGGLVNKMGFDKTEVPMTVNLCIKIPQVAPGGQVVALPVWIEWHDESRTNR